MTIIGRLKVLFFCKMEERGLGTVLTAYTPRTWEAEAGGIAVIWATEQECACKNECGISVICCCTANQASILCCKQSPIVCTMCGLGIRLGLGCIFQVKLSLEGESECCVGLWSYLTGEGPTSELTEGIECLQFLKGFRAKASVACSLEGTLSCPE